VFESVVGVAFGQGMSTVLRAADLPSHLDVGEASIDVYFDSDLFDLGHAALLDWVMQSVSFGEPKARCRVTVSQHVTEANLDDDWVLTHEMIHFGFPSVEERHHWIEEGIATYVGRLPEPRLED
jgi:hypothetical protein